MNRFTLAATLALTAGAAAAAPITYGPDVDTGRTAFQSAAGPLTLESFEAPFAPGSSLTFGDVTITLSTGTFERGTNARYVSDGAAALAFGEGPASTITFSFAKAISAFGVDFNDITTSSASARDSRGNDFGTVLTGDGGGAKGGPGFENLQFFGLTNAAGFTSVTFELAAANNGSIAFDRLEFASLGNVSAIPVPAGLPLLLTGLGGLALMARRQRRARRAAG